MTDVKRLLAVLSVVGFLLMGSLSHASEKPALELVKWSVHPIRDAAGIFLAIHTCYNWKATIKNISDKPVDVYIEIELIDKKGYRIEYTSESGNIGPLGTRTFYGEGTTTLWDECETLSISYEWRKN